MQRQVGAQIKLNQAPAQQGSATLVITVISTLVGLLMMERMELSMVWHSMVMLYMDLTTQIMSFGLATMLTFAMASSSMTALTDMPQLHFTLTLLGVGVQALQ